MLSFTVWELFWYSVGTYIFWTENSITTGCKPTTIASKDGVTSTKPLVLSIISNYKTQLNLAYYLKEISAKTDNYRILNIHFILPSFIYQQIVFIVVNKVFQRYT